ncbi:MAG: TGS domain-containing protein, partial [Planctomycetaceae bacterium]|nr:TGS domain-containing protein [Planctomycetaceae bacterium]
MLKITLPDGSVREYNRSVCPMDVAAEIGAGLAKATLGAVVNGEITGVDTPLPESGEVSLRLLTKKDPESLDIMRHSAAHLMARAVMRLYPDVQLAFGPTVENGFYYDLWRVPSQSVRQHGRDSGKDARQHGQMALSEEDFPNIEAEMAKLIKADEAFERLEYSKDEAVALCQAMGQTLKVEHLNEGLGERDLVSFYRQGEFLDLCRGPHIPSPKAIGAFKLLSIAGAYWKGDASRQQLQRLYATAFFDKKELDDYLFQLEEAKKRDHRVLGKRHELFVIDPKVG